MAVLKDNPTLGDLQRYIQKICERHGWDKDSVHKKFLLYTEEFGELAEAAEAIERLELYSRDKEVEEKRFDFKEKFADILICLAELQKVCEECGQNEDDQYKKFLSLMIKIGKLAKAIRKKSNLYCEKPK